MSLDAEPLWIPEGDAWRAAPCARGPWDPDALHGGPVAGLVARELERLAAPVSMRWTRLTLEILRPVRFGRIEVRAEVTRPGRRIELARAELSVDGELVVAATGWRMRREEGALIGLPDPPPPLEPGPEELPEAPVPDALPPESFGGPPTEQRFARGDWGTGSSVVWMRLRAPLVAGEEPSGLQRAAALGDFGNGVSAAVPWEGHVFVNTDLTIALAREPEGEWLALDATTQLDPSGSGLAQSALSDRRGVCGRALQSLYAGRR